jgi:hypothetical protein
MKLLLFQCESDQLPRQVQVMCDKMSSRVCYCTECVSNNRCSDS